MIKNSFFKNISSQKKTNASFAVYKGPMLPKKVLIEAKNLTQIYKNRNVENKVFENISFNIYEGDRLALLGGNGAGKTTLVEIIAGFKKPTSGEIIKNFDEDLPSSKQIAVQFQDLSFPKSLKVKDVLKFVVNLDDINLESQEFESMLSAFQLESILFKKLSKLSGGQQQRLNVLLALLNKPKVLFLDEFSTGLDIASKKRIKDFILDFCYKNSITLVIISHDIDMIAEMCTRVVLIKDGMIAIDLEREEIDKKFKNINEMLYKYITS